MVDNENTNARMGIAAS